MEGKVCLLLFSGKTGWWLKTPGSAEMFVFPHTFPGSKLLKIAAVTRVTCLRALWSLSLGKTT